MGQAAIGPGRPVGLKTQHIINLVRPEQSPSLLNLQLAWFQELSRRVSRIKLHANLWVYNLGATSASTYMFLSIVGSMFDLSYPIKRKKKKK